MRATRRAGLQADSVGSRSCPFNLLAERKRLDRFAEHAAGWRFVDVLKLPLLYGSVGGLVLALTQTTLPRIVMEPIEMLADMAADPTPYEELR